MEIASELDNLIGIAAILGLKWPFSLKREFIAKYSNHITTGVHRSSLLGNFSRICPAYNGTQPP